MEIWIKDNEIIERMKSVLKELSDEKKELYNNSPYPVIVEQKKSITHKDVIEFCLLLNVSYKYIMIGIGSIIDIDEKNHLYESLIEKCDYTI